MKSLVIVFCICVMATTAFATLDPDPYMVGVYFDQNADVVCATMAPSTPTNVYFIFTNVTAPLVYGVEFGYTVTGSEGLWFRLGEILAPGGLQVGNSVDITSGDYIVGIGSPMPGAGGNVIAVTWSVMLLAPGPLDFFIGPSNPESIIDGLPAIEIGGVIQSVGTSTGWPEAGNPVARVNSAECDVVATEEASFGSVKSLFR